LLSLAGFSAVFQGAGHFFFAGLTHEVLLQVEAGLDEGAALILVAPLLRDRSFAFLAAALWTDGWFYELDLVVDVSNYCSEIATATLAINNERIRFILFRHRTLH
jgi:hypothetical protein